MRFNSYQPKLSPEAAAYVQRVTALPAVAAWIEAARRETHIVANDELAP
jgi:glutathione S-transferase